MAERAPLLSQEKTNEEQYDEPSFNRYVSIRPHTAPPVHRYEDSDDSDDGMFSLFSKRRPNSSLEQRFFADNGVSLNRDDSATQDDTIVDGESDKQTVVKTNWVNIIMMAIVLIIYAVAEKIHSPVYSQYLYRRVMQDMFGNVSLPNANHSEMNTTTCFKPSANRSQHLNDSFSIQEEAQKATAEINMKISLVFFSISFIGTILFGSYSDYFGRKMLFMIPLIGHLIDYTIVTAVIYFDLSVNYFYLTSVVTGFCTGELFTIGTYVYVADNTPSQASRTVGMAFIYVVEALTTSALSTGVGYYIQLEGFFLPSATAVGVLVLDMMAVVCILPTTRRVSADPAVRKKKQNERSKLSPITAVKNVFGFYFFEGTCKTKAMFQLYLVAYFCHEIAMKMGDIGSLWQMNWPLCWTPEMIGYYSTGATIFQELIKIPLLKFCQCLFKEEIIAIFSNLMFMGSMVLKSFSVTNIMMYGVAFMQAFDVSVSTIIKSILSQMAGPERQGAVFSSVAIVAITCDLLGTPAFSELYMYTLNLFVGTSYLVSAGLQLLATFFLVIFAILESKGYRPTGEAIRLKSNDTTTTKQHTETNEDSKV